MMTLNHAQPATSGPQATPAQAAPDALSTAGLAALTLAGLTIPYNYNAAVVALPTIKGFFDASDAAAEWVLAAYGLPLGAFLILGGRLGDRYGRRRLMGIGFALLAVSALASGFATDIVTLLALRAVQGFAAGLALPQILATIQATTTGARRAQAISLFTAAAGAGTVFGQVGGGLLISAFSWPGVLWNTAVLSAATLVGLAAVTPAQAAHKTSMDPIGVVFLAACLTLLLTPMTLAPTMGAAWLLLLVPAFGAFALFWRHEHAYNGTPIVPPAVLEHRPVLAGLGAIALFFFAFGGFGYLFALTTQQGLHYSALQSGLALGPFSVAYLVASMVAAKLVVRYEGVRVSQVGLAGQAVGLLALGALLAASWPHPNVWAMQAVLVGLGFLQGLIYAPLVGTVMSHVPTELAGLTGGITTTSQQVMMAMGIAGFGAMLSLATAVAGFQQAAGLSFAAAAVVAILGAVLVRKARG